MSFQYSVNLNDPVDLGTTVDGELITDMQAALADWAQYITGLGTLVVQINVVSTATGRESGGPTSAVPVGTSSNGNPVNQASSVYELTTGQHVAGTTSDITVSVDPTYLQTVFLNPNPGNGATVPSNQLDGVSVFRHELGHGFGISGNYAQSGILNSARESVYDSKVVASSGMLTVFTGAAAEAVYGGPVPLTTNSTTQNYYHLANAVTDPLGQDLMNGIVFKYGATYQISNVDLAILKDVGVPVTSFIAKSLVITTPSSAIFTPAGTLTVVTDNSAGGPNTIIAQGVDTINAGLGTDLVFASGAAATVNGGSGGTLVVVCGGGVYSVAGGGAATTVYGGAGASVFTAGSGKGGSVLVAGSGNSSLNGGAGARVTMFGNTGGVSFAASSGGGDIMVAGGGANSFVMTTSETAFGGSGSDRFALSGGGNVIVAGSGGESVSFGTGNSVAFDGAGVDSYAISSQSAGVSGIVGFKASDHLIIAGLAKGTTVAQVLAGATTGGFGTSLQLGGATVVLYGLQSVSGGQITLA